MDDQSKPMPKDDPFLDLLKRQDAQDREVLRELQGRIREAEQKVEAQLCEGGAKVPYEGLRAALDAPNPYLPALEDRKAGAGYGGICRSVVSDWRRGLDQGPLGFGPDGHLVGEPAHVLKHERSALEGAFRGLLEDFLREAGRMIAPTALIPPAVGGAVDRAARTCAEFIAQRYGHVASIAQACDLQAAHIRRLEGLLHLDREPAPTQAVVDQIRQDGIVATAARIAGLEGRAQDVWAAAKRAEEEYRAREAEARHQHSRDLERLAKANAALREERDRAQDALQRLAQRAANPPAVMDFPANPVPAVTGKHDHGLLAACTPSCPVHDPFAAAAASATPRPGPCLRAEEKPYPSDEDLLTD